MANRWLQIATLLVPLLALATERGSAENLPPSTERCGPVVATADSSAAEVAYGLARKAWTLDAYPEAVQFVVHVNVQNHGKNLLIHYRGEEEVRRGNIHVDRFSAEEMARPYVPHGINVYLTLGVSTGGATITGAGRQALTLLSKKLSPDEPTYDLLGTPHLSSAYSFVRSPRIGYHRSADGRFSIQSENDWESIRHSSRVRDSLRTDDGG